MSDMNTACPNMNTSCPNMIPDIDVFGQMKNERDKAIARNVAFSWDLEIAEENVKRLTNENNVLKDRILKKDQYANEMRAARDMSWERNRELEAEIDILKKEKPIKLNNSLVTDDTTAIVEAYEHLATAYGIAETLAKLYAVREAGKPVELTASEIAYKIDTAIKLLKDEE